MTRASSRVMTLHWQQWWTVCSEIISSWFRVDICHIWTVTHIKGESGLDLCKTAAAKTHKHVSEWESGESGVGRWLHWWQKEKIRSRIKEGRKEGREENRDDSREGCEDKHPSPDVAGSARWILDDAMPASCSCSLPALFAAISQKQHC